MVDTQHRMLDHDYADVLDVRVSAIDMERAVHLSCELIGTRTPGYICVTGVHGVMEAQDNPEFLSILNGATVNLPDGMPLTWVGKLQRFRNMDRVYGPEFMLQMCNISLSKGYRHFLYGGQDGVAQQLACRLQERFPGLQVAGTYTPPFRALNTIERQELLQMVEASQPDIFWVGLSTPKQEKFMSEYVRHLNVPMLVGVGAAFDIHTGRIRDAPRWMKRSGLQWSHRLFQEPGRLWRRYLINNPRFVVRIAWQLLSRN